MCQFYQKTERVILMLPRKEKPEESKNSNLLFVSNKQDGTIFPHDLSTLTFIEHMSGGSGGAYRLQDAKGNQYTFKAHEDLDHMQEEMISDALYQALGCPVPDFVIVNQIPACLENKNLPGNGIYRLAAFIPAHESKDSMLLKQELAKHFLVDVLLANWDIAVGHFKNVILHKNNSILYRIDNGGALRCRAMQDLNRQGYYDWSAYHVDELDTLRDLIRNPDAAEIYGHLTQKDLEEQHQQLLTHVNALFTTLNQLRDVLNIDQIEDLQDFIARRLYDLEIRIHKTPHPYANAFENVSADENHNSASILVTSTVSGVPCVLFGERIDDGWCSDLGGKSERADLNLFTTASREAYEETAGKVHVSPAYLASCPSHDLITEEKGKQQHTHRMFMTERDYISEQVLLEAVQKDTSHNQEHLHFIWVPIDALLLAVKTNKVVIQGGKETFQVTYMVPNTGEEKTITLFPPMAKMLCQAPVKENLHNRKQNLPWSCKRTRSHAEVDYKDFQTTPSVLSYSPDGYSKYSLYYEQGQLNGQLIKEQVYPDPTAERKALIHTTVAMASVNQQIKKAERKTDAPQSAMGQKPTQTVAHLQGLLNCHEYKPEVLVPEFFKNIMPLSDIATDAPFQAKLIDVIKAESNYPDHVVLYHATNSKIGFFYDFISMLRSVLILKDIRSLRAFDEAFQGIDNVEAFLDDQCKKLGFEKRQHTGDYTGNYGERGLSCNFSLFGNYDVDRSSSTKYLYEDQSASNNTITELNRAITMVLEHLNINSVTVQEIEALFVKHKDHLGTHLYQIFIEPNQVNSLCYLYFSGDIEEQHKPLSIITALRDNPHVFLVENEKLTRGRNMEVRLYMHPARMHDTQSVIINVRKIKEEYDLLQNELSIFVRRIAEELLQKKQNLQSNYEGSIQGHAKLTPLQRKYAYVMQGEVTYEIDHENVNVNVKKLYKYIDSGNVEAFERTLKLIPKGTHFTETICHGFYNDEKPLFLYMLEKQNMDIITVFLKSTHCTSEHLMQTDKDKHTVFMLAAQKGCAVLVNILLHSEHFTSECFGQTDNYGRTAFMLAAMSGDVETFKKLLESQYCTPECVRQVDNHGNTAFKLAAENGHASIVKILLQSEHCTPEYFRQGGFRDTALCAAIRENREEVVKILIQSKYCTLECFKLADGEWRDAAEAGNTEMVIILSESELCTEEFFTQADYLERTVLMLAAQEGRTEVVSILVESKHCTLTFLNLKDKRKFDDRRYTALELAEKYQHTSIINILKTKINQLTQNNVDVSSDSVKSLLTQDAAFFKTASSKMTAENKTTVDFTMDYRGK